MDNNRKIEYDIAYMKMAIAMSELSYAERHKVGAIIVSKEGQVISQGYNGTPTGFANCCEDARCSCKMTDNISNGKLICVYDDYSKPIDEVVSVSHCLNVRKKYGDCGYLSLVTKPEVLHAESNAITKCAKWTSSTDGATLYVTLSPCIECSKLIIQAGIKRVVFLEKYHTTTGIDILKYGNIVVEQLDMNSHELFRM